MVKVHSIQTQKQLETAYDNSYYFIAGCGDPLEEWVEGYEDLLAEHNIGKPVRWYQTTGAAVNRYAGDIPSPSDYFQEDVTCLLFPLNRLDTGKLAIFRIQMQDRWFDDVIQNMRRPL